LTDISTALLNASKTIRDNGPYESVIYTPSGGDAVARTALITRKSFRTINGRVVSYAAEITLVNDADEGIDAGGITTGLDQIQYPHRVGDTVASMPKRTIKDIIYHDAGSITVGVM
jgi:hypothetical protein